MKRKLQNKVAESSLTLPVAGIVATLLWWLPQGNYSLECLLGWLCCAVTTYIIIELTAVNSLLRVRSRMVSTMFLLLTATCVFLHPAQTGTVLSLLLALSLFALFRTYENKQATTDTFHTYLCLSVGSLLWPPFLLLTPLFLWCQGIFLRSLSWRTFRTACLSILLPYWLWASAAFLLADVTAISHHIAAIISPFSEPFHWQWVIDLARTTDWDGFADGAQQQMMQHVTAHLPELTALAVLFLMGLTGFVHYLRKSYDDSVRVRMCYYTFLLLQVAFTLWLFLQPSLFYQLFPLLLLTTAPAIAHFFTLTHTWMTNAWFFVCVILLTCNAVINFAL